MNATFPMFMRRFGLKPYDGPGKPLVMFGCYGRSDVNAVRCNDAPVVMAWMGSDFALYGSDSVWRRKHVRHVAIGPWMESDLKSAGLQYRRLNLIGSPLVDVIRPEPLGNSVYVYLPEKRRDYYGGDVIDDVVDRLRDEMNFIIHSGLDLPQEAMPGVYRRCFAGLRPVRHDGGGETVVELGLMGRRTVHNGDVPSSIPWETVDDIVDALRAEQSVEQFTPEVSILSKRVRGHIQMTDEWLDLEDW